MTTFINDSNLRMNPQHLLTGTSCAYNQKLFLKNTLFEKLAEFNPVFSFYIKSVSKTLRKNSRGKSGKYMLVWKYVPIYKRLFLTMRWFLKSLRFQRARGFYGRLVRIIEDFLLNPDQTFVSKLRKFTHKFVFLKHRQTLMKTLKTV